MTIIWFSLFFLSTGPHVPRIFVTLDRWSSPAVTPLNTSSAVTEAHHRGDRMNTEQNLNMFSFIYHP